MIEKKLIVFKKDENFKRELEAGNIKNTSWVIVKDTKKLYVNGVEIESVDWDKVQQLINSSINDLDLENQLREYVKKNELQNYYTKSETYSKEEVDNLIEEIDVTEQLTDYAKTEYVDTELAKKADKSELSKYAEIEKTTVIKTESGEVIKELTIVEGGEEDSVEVYTKEQCDERFMKVWFGSESDYNSLGEYDNNTIYVIQ